MVKQTSGNVPKASIAAKIQHLKIMLHDCNVQDSIEVTLVDQYSA
jgi:hypothetical protein